MWAYFLLVLALIAWGLHLGWRWKQTRDFAPQLLASRQESGELPATVEAREFTDLYLRAEGPRAGTYVFVCAAFMTFALAPISSLFNNIWNTIWQATGRDPVFETGTFIHTFSFFLAVMGLTVLILAVAMRRYYALMPPNLRQIIRDLKDAHS